MYYPENNPALMNRASRRAQAKALRKSNPQANKADALAIKLTSEGYYGVLQSIATDAVRTFGPPPTHAEVAAAHEAGHVIVGLAMGGSFEEAYIENRNGSWGGFTKVHVPGVHSPHDCDIRENPHRAWLLTLNKGAGIQGEMLAGLHHPASSVDEMFTVMSLAAGLHLEFALPPEIILLELMAVNARVIDTNKSAFQRLSNLLLAHKQVRRADIAGIPVVQFTHDQLIPAWMATKSAGGAK